MVRENYVPMRMSSNNNIPPDKTFTLEALFTETTEAVTATPLYFAEKVLHDNDVKKDTAQDVVTGEGWNWLDKCHSCTGVHLYHSTSYHDFFAEVANVEVYLSDIRSRLTVAFETTDLQGDVKDFEIISGDIENILLRFLDVESRVLALYDVSTTVNPLELRHLPLGCPRWAILLCDIPCDEIYLKEGKKVTLVDNSGFQWKVKTDEGEEFIVPSLAVSILPPSDLAGDASLKLLRQLGVTWKYSIKKLSLQILCHLSLVFRNLDANDISVLWNISSEEKQEIMKLADIIKSVLRPVCEDWDVFDVLIERLEELETSLKEDITDDIHTPDNPRAVILQLSLMKKLINRYQDFVDYCGNFSDTFNSLVPLTHIIYPTNGHQYISYVYYNRFKHCELSTDGDGSQADGSIIIHESPKETLDVAALTKLEVMTSEMTDADQITKSTEEDQTTFTIDGVFDPIKKEFVSLEDAIGLELFDDETNMYWDPLTGKEMPIAQAINSGKVRMKITNTKKVSEKESSYGVIVVKIKRETKPFEITNVVDSYTGEWLSLQEALSHGIYDIEREVYIKSDGQHVQASDAIESGLIEIKYGEKFTDSEIQTFAVYSVTDQKRNITLSFSDAIHSQILDKEKGTYHDNIKDEYIPIHDAIQQGFINAKVLDEKNAAAIDPRNTIVVERFKRIRGKLLSAMRMQNSTKQQHK